MVRLLSGSSIIILENYQYLLSLNTISKGSFNKWDFLLTPYVGIAYKSVQN